MQGELVDCVTKDGVKLDGFLAHGRSSDCWLLTHGVNDSFYASKLLRELAQRLHQAGSTVLLVNNRGHDVCAVSVSPIPMRIGSQFESVEKCLNDLDAWADFAEQRGLSLTSIAAHSLGAIKSAYWVANRGRRQLQKLVLLSPPRLNTKLLGDDPKRGDAFREDLRHARELCESGAADRVLRVRYPLPNWLSAATFVDKYGAEGKYDYFTWLSEISCPTLWTFGESEVRRGSLNFRDADIELATRFELEGLPHHQVAVIERGDHSYRNVTSELSDQVVAWIDEVGS